MMPYSAALNSSKISKWLYFIDSMGGGAWLFLVGGVICLVNSVDPPAQLTSVVAFHLSSCQSPRVQRQHLSGGMYVYVCVVPFDHRSCAHAFSTVLSRVTVGKISPPNNFSQSLAAGLPSLPLIDPGLGGSSNRTASQAVIRYFSIKEQKITNTQRYTDRTKNAEK